MLSACGTLVCDGNTGVLGRELSQHGIDFDDAIAISEGTTLENEDERFEYGEPIVRAIGALGQFLISVIYTMRSDPYRAGSAPKTSSRKSRPER
jgi:uncharacterized DUF497 family protein